MLTLGLPWPPSVNNFKIPRRGARGKYYLTVQAVRFRRDVQFLCASARRFSAEDDIELDITLHPPTAARRDADNYNKAIWDALEAAGIFADDSQVQEYHVRKAPVVPLGHVVVKVWRQEKKG